MVTRMMIQRLMNVSLKSFYRHVEHLMVRTVCVPEGEDPETPSVTGGGARAAAGEGALSTSSMTLAGTAGGGGGRNMASSPLSGQVEGSAPPSKRART